MRAKQGRGGTYRRLYTFLIVSRRSSGAKDSRERRPSKRVKTWLGVRKMMVSVSEQEQQQHLEIR